ncbi:MAG: hypothetical protein ACR2PS_07980 [Pseudomonadales bacterium]
MNAMNLTMDSANSLLEEQGIEGRFTQTLFDRALKQHRVKRICEAIGRAKREPGALRFIENLLSAPVPADGPRTRDTNATDSVTDTARTNTPPGIQEERGEFFPPLLFKVYGAKSALEFREHTATKKYATVIIEAAGAIGPRNYDWSNKTAVQVMDRELPAVASVLSGLTPKCEFKNHGPGKNKGYSIEAQKGAFFVRVFRSGDNKAMHAVPMPAEDSFYINAMILRQLARAIPDVDGALIGAALRAYARIAYTG